MQYDATGHPFPPHHSASCVTSRNYTLQIFKRKLATFCAVRVPENLWESTRTGSDLETISSTRICVISDDFHLQLILMVFTKDNPGKGCNFCPECGAANAIRKKECRCGYSFAKHWKLARQEKLAKLRAKGAEVTSRNHGKTMSHIEERVCIIILLLPCPNLVIKLVYM